MKPLKLTPAKGGWLYADWGDGSAWVRFALDKNEKLRRIDALHFANPTPAKLRRVPLARIHAAATMRGAGLVQLMLAVGLNEQPPPEMFDEPPRPSLDLTRRHVLKRPSGRALDDAFYDEVAHAYQSALALGLAPRKVMAEDTGVKDATVARWIWEARKHRKLPKTRPGKAKAHVMEEEG